MGERKGRVKASPEEIEREVEELREDMDPVIQELDVRRQELTDVPLQLRRNAPMLLRAGAVVAGVYVGMQVIRSLNRQMQQRRRMRRQSG